MSHNARVTFWYGWDLLVISGALMLIIGVCLKIYRSINKQAYPSQPRWGEPELLCVIGFFVFAIPQIVSEYFFPVF